MTLSLNLRLLVTTFVRERCRAASGRAPKEHGEAHREHRGAAREPVRAEREQVNEMGFSAGAKPGCLSHRKVR